jgi:hypothetical protein
MDPKLIPILTDGLGEYYSGMEIHDLCRAFDIDPETDLRQNRPAYHKLAIKLLTKAEHGRNRQLLVASFPVW